MGWDEAREQASNALAALRAKEVATRGSTTTIEIAILEAIVDLDSAQTDAVETLGDGRLLEYTEDGYVRPGQLQRLDKLETTFFGDGSGRNGLLAAMRTMADPSSTSE